MDTKHLYYAAQVAEYRSISKAADVLYLSQPTLSQHISKLETQLGCKLFDRNTIPLKLTYEGEVFIDYALKILELEKSLIHRMQSSKNVINGRITIGIPTCYGATILPKVLPVFKQQFPHVEIQLIEESSTTLETLLEKNLIDLAIMNLPIDNKSLLYETLLIDHVVLAVPNVFLSQENRTQYPLTPESLLESTSLHPYITTPKHNTYIDRRTNHRTHDTLRKVEEKKHFHFLSRCE